jgi:hypothetical protein
MPVSGLGTAFSAFKLSLVHLFRTLATPHVEAGHVEESQRATNLVLEHTGGGVARERSRLAVGRVCGSVVLGSLYRPLMEGWMDGSKGELR